MIETAATVMRERGVEATSFSEVLARSGAPRGSIYHHFPHGKAQLIEEATAYAGRFTADGIRQAIAQGDPVGAAHAFIAMWLELLRDSDFSAGCPVVAATLESDRAPGARAKAADAFTSWQELLAEALEPHLQHDRERARSLAMLVVASIEGAVIVSRAVRSTEPLERVAGELEQLLSATIAQ